MIYTIKIRPVRQTDIQIVKSQTGRSGLKYGIRMADEITTPAMRKEIIK